MKKIRTGWKLPPLCLPVALFGANVRGRPNFFTIAWFNMLQEYPPLLFFMPEGPYLKTGNVIAKAFEVGRDLKLLKKTTRRRE